MSRLAISLVFAVGCTGTIDNQLPPGLTPAQAKALQLWTQKALPILKMQCFTGCHDGSVPADGWLMGTSDTMIRDTAIGFMPPVVNLNSPATSTMVTKGMHEGPPLTASQATDIVDWITAERDARTTGMVIETAQVMPMLGQTNTIDLSSLGTMGASFEFTAQNVGADLYLTQMQFKAAADGIYAVHPLFVAYADPGTGSGSGSGSDAGSGAGSGSAGPMAIPDSIDRYAATTINIMANMTAKLGTGNATFAGFAGKPIAIRFDMYDKYHPGM